MDWTIGVDVGGTFTDFFALNSVEGTVIVHKTLSTPENPAEAIVDGLRELVDQRGISPEGIGRFCHGTTVGTNTLIQRTGATVAVVTTKGFRDLLEIGRQIRPKIFSFQEDFPPPLADRKNRFEIGERIGPEGEVISALTETDVRQAVVSVRNSGAESCAVCFLFSYLNEKHERSLAKAIQEALPDTFLSLSSDVYPEVREYERFSTTVLNAYLQPVFDRYLNLLESTLERFIPAAIVGISQSNGGLTSIDRARRYPIRTALSGPAAGVVGAIYSVSKTTYSNIITLDMGGTSADVGLIRDREADVGTTRDVAGFPVRLPMVDIHTVGAGGGSIAWFDRDGLLKVGPQSAGADPGPACYGAGGTEPTVSDANAVLGRLDPTGLLDGAMALDFTAARGAIAPIASQLGFSVEKTAYGMIEIVVANMVRAVRKISIERGYDPRDFVLMAFGGAGGLHAVEVAKMLGIETVIVPASPGILCAQGLVIADQKEDLVKSVRVNVDQNYGELAEQQIIELNHQLLAWFESENIAEVNRSQQVVFDMRYVGQNYELRVPLHQATAGCVPSCENLKALFFENHDRSYGYFNPDGAVEIINIRLTGIGRRRIPQSAKLVPTSTRHVTAASHRPVFFDPDRARDTPIFWREEFEPGHSVEGPAILNQLDATTVLFPDNRAFVDDALNIIIEVNP